jgi:hypothetical protein
MGTQAYGVDIQGRVEKLRLGRREGLNAIFEAIYNSMQAIEDGDLGNGSIEIKINRDNTVESLALDGDNSLPKIVGFEITDNGIGFNDVNLKSFMTSDSRHKVKRGGKGVGRFLWLKVFKEISVKSTYKESDKCFERSFKFELQEELFDEKREVEVCDPQTTISFKNIYSEYEDGFSKKPETIAWRIIEHLILDFLNKKAPDIILIDSGKRISLNQIFENEISGTVVETEIFVHDKKFHQKTFRTRRSPNEASTIFYCADGRGVQAERLSNHIPQLRGKIPFGSEEFFVISCISGEYLDKSVNHERTAFTFSKDSDLDLFSQDSLTSKALEEIRKYAGEYIKKVQKETSEKVKDYIEQKAPEYKFLLQDKYREQIETIEPDIEESSLDAKLHMIKFELAIQLRKTSRALVTKAIDSQSDLDEYKTRLSEYIERENEIGKADLIKYIIHRKIILELLEKSLELQADNRYPLEEEIHKIIHPLRTTSQEVDFFDQNLWIIDERLSFHRYLASDKQFKNVPVVQTESTQRPDIIAYFDNPIAFADSNTDFQSLVVIEFKRAARNDYNDDENPLNQVAEYVDLIRSGSAKDFKGRPISNKDIPIFCYIICDITPKLQKQLQIASYRRMFDGQGYYFFNDQLNYYSEVISYNKLVSDAKKRNRVFFEMLQIPV